MWPNDRTLPMMPGSNPYESPHCESGVKAVSCPAHPPYVASVILWLLGVFMLLLLNGQVFSNALVFLGLVAMSAIMWGRLLIRRNRSIQRRLAVCVLIAHFVVLFIVAIVLPSRFRQQQEHNRTVERAVERLRGGGD